MVYSTLWVVVCIAVLLHLRAAQHNGLTYRIAFFYKQLLPFQKAHPGLVLWPRVGQIGVTVL